MTLDQFLPPYATKPRQDPGISVEERCTECGNKLSFKEPKYILRIKGKEGPYCPRCAKKILRPLENTEASL